MDLRRSPITGDDPDDLHPILHRNAFWATVTTKLDEPYTVLWSLVKQYYYPYHILYKICTYWNNESWLVGIRKYVNNHPEQHKSLLLRLPPSIKSYLWTFIDDYELEMLETHVSQFLFYDWFRTPKWRNIWIQLLTIDAPAANKLNDLEEIVSECDLSKMCVYDCRLFNIEQIKSWNAHISQININANMNIIDNNTNVDASNNCSTNKPVISGELAADETGDTDTDEVVLTIDKLYDDVIMYIIYFLDQISYLRMAVCNKEHWYSRMAYVPLLLHIPIFKNLIITDAMQAKFDPSISSYFFFDYIIHWDYWVKSKPQLSNRWIPQYVKTYAGNYIEFCLSTRKCKFLDYIWLHGLEYGYDEYVSAGPTNRVYFSESSKFYGVLDVQCKSFVAAHTRLSASNLHRILQTTQCNTFIGWNLTLYEDYAHAPDNGPVCRDKNVILIGANHWINWLIIFFSDWFTTRVKNLTFVFDWSECGGWCTIFLLQMINDYVFEGIESVKMFGYCSSLDNVEPIDEFWDFIKQNIKDIVKAFDFEATIFVDRVQDNLGVSSFNLQQVLQANVADAHHQQWRTMLLDQSFCPKNPVALNQWRKLVATIV